MTGAFTEADGQTWYRIDHPDSAPPSFMTLAGDTRGDELALWMAELGYNIAEIEEDAA